MKMNFDDFLHKKDLIEKYKKYREFFNQANTHEELDGLKYQLEQSDDEDNVDIPEDVLNFFYQERKNQLGAKINYRDKSNTFISYTPDEIALARSLSDRSFYKPSI